MSREQKKESKRRSGTCKDWQWKGKAEDSGTTVAAYADSASGSEGRSIGFDLHQEEQPRLGCSQIEIVRKG